MSCTDVPPEDCRLRTGKLCTIGRPAGLCHGGQGDIGRGDEIEPGGQIRALGRAR